MDKFLNPKQVLKKALSQNVPGFLAETVKKSNQWHAKTGHIWHFECYK